MAAEPFEPLRVVFCDPSPDALPRIQALSAAPSAAPAPNASAPDPTPGGSGSSEAPCMDSHAGNVNSAHHASTELPPTTPWSFPSMPFLPPDGIDADLSQHVSVAIARSRSLPQPPPSPLLPSSLLPCKSGSGTPAFPPVPPAVPCMQTQIGTDGASAMQAGASAFEMLEVESHQLRIDLSARVHADTATGAKYKAHYDSYTKWWDANAPDLLAKHGIEAVIPALPITAMKVSFFLQHETTREKRKHGSNETIAGSSVGASHIAGVITALEKYRKDFAHLYKSDPDAQKKLRDDARISAIERAMRHNEPQRNDSANALKASGTSSDAYTPEDLQTCALWCITSSRTAEQLSLGLRDRAMLLVCAGTAFRGDSARALQWSDLFLTQVYIPDIGPDYRLPVLGILADNAKHNQQGRVDEHGVIRHRIVELCPVGAIALHLWAYFHILCKPVPDFVPDFTDKAFGEFGRRDWYVYHLFYASDISREMTYENHHNRFKSMHIHNDIAVTKVTHATRHYGALNARNHGASVAGTKAMGGWNESSGAFRGCYDRSLPLDALLASAMFNGRQPSSYFLARDVLVPPAHLLCLIFPWVEQEQRALAERAHERVGSDIALESFLSVLIWFRRVLLQDAAVLFSRRPELPIFSRPPFNTQEFRVFAEGTSDKIAAAEEEARAAYQNLPQVLVHTMQGITTGWVLDRERERAEARARYAEISDQLLEVKAELQMQNSSRKRRCAPVNADASMAATAAPPVSAQQPTLPGAATTVLLSHPAPSYAACAAPAAAQVSTTVPAPAPGLQHAPAQPVPWLPSNPLPSTKPDPSTSKREKLRQLYGDDRIMRHPWQLNAGILVPSYNMQPASTIEDIWREYTSGLNGYLPVRELEEHFGPKWRCNVPRVKTEWGRRKKVIALIQKLAAKPRWDIDLTLRFLRTEYKVYSGRKFCEYLQSTKLNAEAEILERAQSFTA